MENKKQKDVIFEVVKEFLGNTYSPTMPCRDLVNADEVVLRLIKKVENAELTIDKKLSNPKELSIYLKKLVFNWLNKDERLNGGQKYKDIKAPKRVHWSVHRAVTQEKQPIVHDIFNDYKVKEIIKLIHQYEGQHDSHDIAVAAFIERVLVISENKLTIQIEKRILIEEKRLQNEIENMKSLKEAGYTAEEVRYVIYGGIDPGIKEVEEEIEVIDPKTNKVIKQKVKILKYKSKKVA